ncbi:MAG TPA: cupin domain-containing protein [Actinomycetota bacterium]|nr:cupin domain-containing protein [Actinomycetota bacterium]
MGSVTFEDLRELVTIQPGAVVSKVVYREGGVDVTVFGFDAGEGLAEHAAARAAIVQVLAGDLRFEVEGREERLRHGSWVTMSPGTVHSLEAVEPTIMLLTMLPGGDPSPEAAEPA